MEAPNPISSFFKQMFLTLWGWIQWFFILIFRLIGGLIAWIVLQIKDILKFVLWAWGLALATLIAVGLCFFLFTAGFKNLEESPVGQKYILKFEPFIEYRADQQVEELKLGRGLDQLQKDFEKKITESTVSGETTPPTTATTVSPQPEVILKAGEPLSAEAIDELEKAVIKEIPMTPSQPQ